MRLILLALCAGLCLTTHAQQSNFLLTGTMATAAGVQCGKLKNAYGIGTGLEIPIMKSNIKWTLGMGVYINGISNEPYEFYYQNNYTKTQINLTSYLFDVTSGFRYVFNEGKRVAPFVGVNGGIMKYYSEMIIEDPEDPDGCHALQTESMSSSVSYIARVESGVRITPNPSTCKSSLEIGLGYTRGTEAKYLKLTGDHYVPSEASGEDYMVQFQSANSEIHEHSVGKIFHTPTNQLSFHLAWVVPF